MPKMDYHHSFVMKKARTTPKIRRERKTIIHVRGAS